MKKIAAIIVLIIVGMSIAHAGGFMLLHVGDANGNGGSGPPANALLSQTGVCILAQTGSCILVQ